MSGQKAQSIEFAARSGAIARNPKRYADHDLIPRADGAAPEMPDYFDHHAKEKWNELIGDFQTLGVLSSDCREIFAAYCIAYSQWRRCLDLVRQTGPAIIERDGNSVTIRKNHLSVELHKYAQQMDRLRPEMGLTPSARSRLRSLNVEKQVDQFESLLGRIAQ